MGLTAPEPAKDPGAPTLFADGILNLANSAEFVKFYLARVDPAVAGLHDQHSVIVGQIVMPMSSFLNAVAFLQSALDTLISNGTVAESAWLQAQAAHEKSNVRQ